MEKTSPMECMEIKCMTPGVSKEVRDFVCRELGMELDEGWPGVGDFRCGIKYYFASKTCKTTEEFNAHVKNRDHTGNYLPYDIKKISLKTSEGETKVTESVQKGQVPIAISEAYEEEIQIEAERALSQKNEASQIKLFSIQCKYRNNEEIIIKGHLEYVHNWEIEHKEWRLAVISALEEEEEVGLTSTQKEEVGLTSTQKEEVGFTSTQKEEEGFYLYPCGITLIMPPKPFEDRDPDETCEICRKFEISECGACGTCIVTNKLT